MQVNPVNNVGPVARPAVSPTVVAGARAGRDEADFSQVVALNTALKEAPASRPAEVERARDLVGDVTYPPRETLARISHLLALKIGED